MRAWIAASTSAVMVGMAPKGGGGSGPPPAVLASAAAVSASASAVAGRAGGGGVGAPLRAWVLWSWWLWWWGDEIKNNGLPKTNQQTISDSPQKIDK